MLPLNGAIQRIIINGEVMANLWSVSLEKHGVRVYMGAPCHRHTCDNGGLCVHHFRTAVCRCTPGYSGPKCSTIVTWYLSCFSPSLPVPLCCLSVTPKKPSLDQIILLTFCMVIGTYYLLDQIQNGGFSTTPRGIYAYIQTGFYYCIKNISDWLNTMKTKWLDASYAFHFYLDSNFDIFNIEFYAFLWYFVNYICTSIIF